jgi:hypothetical protein
LQVAGCRLQVAGCRKGEVCLNCEFFRSFSKYYQYYENNARGSLFFFYILSIIYNMDLELLKVLAPYFTSILGAVVAIGIAIFNNSSKAKRIHSKLTEVDNELQELKKNHFFHLGEYLKKLNAFLRRGKLMDDVEKADMYVFADGVSGKK